MIYLDWAASAPMDRVIAEAFLSSIKQDFANPSAAHKLGKDLNKKIESCRSSMLSMLNANKDDQFIFTSSATESNNTLIKGLELNEGSIVYYNPIDHPSLVKPIEYIAKEKKLILKPFSPLNDSWIDEIEESTGLVLLTHVHGQNGLKLDLEKLVPAIKKKAPKAIVHVDAVQGFGKVEIKCKDWMIDSLAISGHKLGAPKGVGGLFLRKDISLTALLHGGGQDIQLRSSTQAASLIFCFEEVSRLKISNMINSFEHVLSLKDMVRELLGHAIDGVEFPFKRADCSPYIQCFIIKGIPSDVLMRHLEVEKIYIASSSACSSKVKGHNPVFEGLGINREMHKNVLRISFGDSTSMEDVEKFCLTLMGTCKEIKKVLG